MDACNFSGVSYSPIAIIQKDFRSLYGESTSTCDASSGKGRRYKKKKAKGKVAENASKWNYNCCILFKCLTKMLFKRFVFIANAQKTVNLENNDHTWNEVNYDLKFTTLYHQVLMHYCTKILDSNIISSKIHNTILYIPIFSPSLLAVNNFIW